MSHLKSQSVKAHTTYIEVATKVKITVNKVDLKGVHIDGQKTPVPLFQFINKVKDRQYIIQ